MTVSPPVQPCCPRCGYDQSGAVATWHDVCPLDGTCPECGHGFAWADLYDPRRRDVAWYVEHARRVAGVVWRMPGTLWRLVRPARFWREVGVGSRVRLGRLVWFLLLWGLGSHVVIASVRFAIEYAGITRSVRRRAGMASTRDETIFAGIDSLLSPIGDLEFNRWAARNGSGPIVFRGVDVPWDLAMTLGASLLWVVVLAVIPTTRSLCKIRGAHVVRAALLSLAAPVISVEVTRAAGCVDLYWRNSPLTGPMWMLVRLLDILLIAWTFRWWWCAVRVGWDLRPTRQVLALGMTASVLGAAVLALLLDMDTIARSPLFR